MYMRHITTMAALVTLLLSCPVYASIRVYTATVGHDRMEFVPEPEKGYVVGTAGVRSQETGVRRQRTALLTEKATPIGGRGLWIVEGQQSPVEDRATTMGDVSYLAPLFSVNGETMAVIPEIVIHVKPGVDTRQVHFLCQSMGLAVIKPMQFTTQEYLLEVLGPDAEAVFTAVEQLNKVDSIEWAAPNTASQPKRAGQALTDYSASGVQLQKTTFGQDANTPGVFPNDEYFPMQWHLHNTGQSGGTPGVDIRAPEAWEITTGDPNVIIAVIDTGVDSNHPDLVSNLAAGYDFYGNDDQPDPARTVGTIDAHGTACAGLVAAQGNNGVGVTGVAYDCKIMPIRDGDTANWISEADEATAFRWAAAHGANVISWSAGLKNVPILHSGVQDVTKFGGIGREGRGCVVLFAAMHNATIDPTSTAAYPEVIAVGATDHNDVRCSYSNDGHQLGVVAPSSPSLSSADLQKANGRGWIWTTDITGLPGFSVSDYTLFTGTSASTPIAAGVAALMLSVEPNLTSDEVRHFLERSAKDLGNPGRDDYYGWGRVDARAALDMVLAKRCDLNGDWKVDEQDLAILDAAIDANDLAADVAPAAKRDGKVNQQDLDLLMRYMGTAIPAIPELGLFAHWKLDEAEGATASDCINHRDGTLQKEATWQPTGGVLGGALQLDGVNDYVSTPFVLNPVSFGPFSVFAWVQGSVPGKVILSQKGGANWLLTDSSGQFMTELKALAGGKTLTSPTFIMDGQWHRVGLSWDGTNRVLYVDGEEVKRDTQAGLASSWNGLYLGAGKGLESSKYWSGLIDDVRIYDRVVKP
jgi:subtilisin family serine protease